MHEMALVRNVVDIVNEEAAKANAKEVKRVYLTIGYARDIVEEYFDGLFAFLGRGTIAEHAELIITRTPVTVRCNQCAKVFPLNVRDPKTWVCPYCGAEKDYKMNSGMEFTINRIEIEHMTPEEVAAAEAAKAAEAADAPAAEAAKATEAANDAEAAPAAE